MKKLIALLYLFLFMPINIFCYSEYIIPGGKNIGITINSNGLVVVGFYKVNGNYIANSTFKLGDVILSVQDEDVDSVASMSSIIEKYVSNDKVNVKIKRDNKIITTNLKLVKDGNLYKTGLFVKDKVNGIGTLSYIDPNTRIYGALGHEIIMSDTSTVVEVKTGNIYDSYVNSIDRSINGSVGSKNATIEFSNNLGNVNKNTAYGIYGKYEEDISNMNTMKVANFNDIKDGEAKILTILKDKTIKEYTINILKHDAKKIKTNKSISFEVTDNELLNKSGGIIQGMSGSPIIQNNMIIGAVTHVVVDDVTKGYGIFIRTMLEEGER